MEDPTNQYNSGHGVPLEALPTEPMHSAEADNTAVIGPKRPRAVDETAWIASCVATHPWRPLARIAAGKGSALLWGGCRLSAETAIFLAKVQRATIAQRWNKDLSPELSFFLDDISPTGEVSLDQAVECLAWAYLLPTIAKQDKTQAAAPLLKRLLEFVDAPAASSSGASVVAQLLLKVELPLLLANFAPDAKTATSLRKGAIGAEARFANSSLDNLSVPQELTAIRPWLASLVRTHELARSTDSPFSDTAKDRLERLARHVLRLSRPDGGSMLQTAAGTANDREFLTAVVMSSPSTTPIAALALGKGKVDKKPIKGMPVAPFYSANSSLAVLRTQWALPQTQATLDFSGSQPWLDVSCGNQSLLHGTWDAAIRVNDAELSPIGPWTEVCWHSDADCDYIEIEQKLSGGWLLQRHLLLVRRDECMLLADSLLDETKRTPEEFLATTAQAPRLDYATSLPLSRGITFAPQQATRDGHLQQGKKPLALVMPIALPEWRKQPVNADLSSMDGLLSHRIRTQGRNLFAPVWFDLNPKRFKGAECTWRQLTIGEHLQVQPREVAVGYRVQIHYSQWLMYRSLAWRGNRTVLGKNYATDFACCRFQPNGETQDILEVQ